MKIPYADSSGHLTARVELRNAADVFLVDESNFCRFEKGLGFNYYGGHYTRSPVILRVEGSGRWYLVVIGSSYRYQFS